ncbi:uncharacterized protein LOC124492796 isoform X2 [Dermatophagoides farinae]|uniref:uncharacterized protein LOC124492796 isoform X2 n=1 Tax=Dermatophagoides farinae TaxID=6954 RepID=UPI003F5ED4EF
MISSTNETFSRSRPNNRSNIRFRHCIRPPDYYSTKWPILWMLCYSSILFISIEPIDGSITQEDANLTLTTSAILNLTSLHNPHVNLHSHNHHHHHHHQLNHQHNSSITNSSSTTTIKAIIEDDESSLPLLPLESSHPSLGIGSSTSSSSSSSTSSFDHTIHPDKNNPKGLRFEEEPADSYIVRSKSAILRCRTLNALNAWFTCNSGDERRIQSNQKISNYVDPQTGIRLIEIDLEITRSDVEEHTNSGYTNPYQCWCTAYGGHHQIMSRKASVSFALNGEWSNWGSWSPCQLAPGLTAQGLKCGIGTQKRVRHCSNPTPVNNGQFCPGESVQVTECTILCPPIDGFWSPWSQWSICSHECTQVRRRICNNPIPEYGGHDCFGSDFLIKNCTGGLCRKNFDPTNFIQPIGSPTTTLQQSNDQIYFIIIFILILIILTFVIYIVLKFQLHRRRHGAKSTASPFNHHSWLNGGTDSDHLSHGSLGPIDPEDSLVPQTSLTPTLLLLQQQDGRFYNKAVKPSGNYNHYPMEPILSKQQQSASATPQKMMLVSRLNQSNQQNGMLDHFLMQPGSGSSLQSTPLHPKGHPLPTIPRDDDSVSFRSGGSSANRYEEPQFHHSLVQPISGVRKSVKKGSPHSSNGGNAGTNSSSGSANTALTTTANDMSQNESEPDYAEPIINEFEQTTNIRPPSLTTAPPISPSPQKNLRYSSEESSGCSDGSNNIGSLCGRHEKFLKINHELTRYGHYSSLPNLGVCLYLPPEFLILTSSMSGNHSMNRATDESNGDLYIRYGIDTRARYPGLCSLSSVITLNLSKQHQHYIDLNRPAILSFRHCLSFPNHQQPIDMASRKNLVIMWQNQQEHQHSSKSSSKWIELIRLDDQQDPNCYAYLDSNHVYLVTRLLGRFMFCYKHDFSQYGSTSTTADSNLELPSTFGSIGRSASKSAESSVISKMVNFSITIEQCSQTEHLIKCFVYDNLPASVLMFQNDQLPSLNSSSESTVMNGQNKLVQVLIGRMSNPLITTAYNSSTKISLPPNRSSALCFELIQQANSTPSHSRIPNIGSNPRMEIPLEHLCSLGPNSMLHCSFMVPNVRNTNILIMDNDENLVDDNDDDQEQDSDDDIDLQDSYDSVDDSSFSPTYENKPTRPYSRRKKSLLKKNYRNLNYEIKVWQQKPETRKRLHHHHSNTLTLNYLNMRPLHRLPSSDSAQQYFYHEESCRLFGDSELELRRSMAERLDLSLYGNDLSPWKEWAMAMLMISRDNSHHGWLTYFERQPSPSIQLMELWESKTITELMIAMVDDKIGRRSHRKRNNNKQSSILMSTNPMKMKELFFSKLLHQIQTTIGGSSDLVDLILGHKF